MVPDLSKAILNLTEGFEGLQIEKKWFGEATPSLDYESPTRLSFQSFKGLFIINGFVLCIMLLINLAKFVFAKYTEPKNTVSQRDDEP